MNKFLSTLVISVLLPFFAYSEPSALIDVRTPSEYSERHLSNAINIDVQADDFSKKISSLDKNKSYQVYCRSGRRSAKAAEVMKAAGFKNVENLGGIDDAEKKLQPKK